MIDWDHVRILRDEIGTDAFEEVVEMFLDEVETGIAKLCAPPGTHNPEVQLHFIKGSALTFGFADFAALCQKGETAASSGQTANVKLTEVLECFDRSKATFLAGLGAEVASV